MDSLKATSQTSVGLGWRPTACQLFSRFYLCQLTQSHHHPRVQRGHRLRCKREETEVQGWGVPRVMLPLSGRTRIKPKLCGPHPVLSTPRSAGDLMLNAPHLGPGSTDEMHLCFIKKNNNKIGDVQSLRHTWTVVEPLSPFLPVSSQWTFV